MSTHFLSRKLSTSWWRAQLILHWAQAKMMDDVFVQLAASLFHLASCIFRWNRINVKAALHCVHVPQCALSLSAKMQAAQTLLQWLKIVGTASCNISVCIIYSWTQTIFVHPCQCTVEYSATFQVTVRNFINLLGNHQYCTLEYWKLSWLSIT